MLFLGHFSSISGETFCAKMARQARRDGEFDTVDCLHIHVDAIACTCRCNCIYMYVQRLPYDIFGKVVSRCEEETVPEGDAKTAEKESPPVRCGTGGLPDYQ